MSGMNGKADHALATSRRRAANAADTDAKGVSGRLVVAVGCLLVMVIWGSIYLIFRDWRARYRVRAEFGATQVAAAIDPLALITPHGVEAGDWRNVVEQTHRLLVTLTGSNVLDRPQMEALRDEIKSMVATAQPETTVKLLSNFWNEQKRKSGPILDRHPTPKLLTPTPIAPAPTPGARTPLPGSMRASLAGSA